MKNILHVLRELICNKSWRRVSYLSVLCLFLTIYTYSVATDDRHHIVFDQEDSPHVIDRLKIGNWIQKYEELNWYSQVGESEFSHHEIPSVEILGKSVPSFDRIVFSLKSLNYILEGQYADYLELVNDQIKGYKLTWDQFQEMKADGQRAVALHTSLTPCQVREVVEFAIVINEVDKTQTFQKKAMVYEIKRVHGRRFVKRMLALHPEVFPTFSRFNREQQHLAEQIFALVDVQEIFRLRDLMGSFEEIKGSRLLKEDPGLFEIAFLVEEAIFAGHRGESNSCSSPTLDCNAYINLLAIRQAVSLLKDSSERDAYKFYLAKRANWLGFDPGSPLNRVLTRFGAMMDLYTESSGKVLKESFLRLKPEELSLIIDQFDEVKMANQTCEYLNVASLMYNLVENPALGAHLRERIASTVSLGFGSLAKTVVLREKRDARSRPTCVNFEEIALIAKTDPEALRSCKLDLAKDGNVSIVH